MDEEKRPFGCESGMLLSHIPLTNLDEFDPPPTPDPSTAILNASEQSTLGQFFYNMDPNNPDTVDQGLDQSILPISDNMLPDPFGATLLECHNTHVYRPTLRSHLFTPSAVSTPNSAFPSARSSQFLYSTATELLGDSKPNGSNSLEILGLYDQDSLVPVGSSSNMMESAPWHDGVSSFAYYNAFTGENEIHNLDLKAESSNYQYGTDPAFQNHRYVIQDSQSSIPRHANALLGALELGSQENSRIAKDSFTHTKRQVEDPISGNLDICSSQLLRSDVKSGKINDKDSRPQKRQRPDTNEEAVHFPCSEVLTAQLKKDKGSVAKKSMVPARKKSPSRQRQQGAGRKSTRENLTEAQKRRNHIESEQKRRTYVKRGQDKLMSLVPALHGANVSKAEVLQQTYEYVERLHYENNLLRSRLRTDHEGHLPYVE